MKLSLFALLLMLSIISPPAFSASNQDILDRLDEMQFEADLKELQRQNNQPYDAQGSLFRDKNLTYLGKSSKNTDYFISNSHTSFDPKSGRYIFSVITSSNNPRAYNNKIFYSSILGMSVYCPGSNMTILISTFFSQPGIIGPVAFEVDRAMNINKDLMRNEPVLLNIKNYICKQK
ncbi:hypothetical protein G6721_06690 [Polynucleobacter paneuropaeus]|nr:hypothetical protein [Polynucleobacter paneuropaeus]